MQQTHFSAEIKPRILSLLDQATESITLAVAWFTDTDLANKLAEALKRGVTIRMMVLSDDINQNGNVDFEVLASLGAKVFYWNKEQNGLMHHKFLVIDKRIVMMGSYNWTNSAANYNQESAIVFDSETTAHDFLAEFEALIAHTIPSDFNQLSNDKRIEWVDVKGRLRARIQELHFLVAEKETALTEAQSLLDQFGIRFRQTLAHWLGEFYSLQTELARLVAKHTQRRSDQEIFEEHQEQKQKFEQQFEKEQNETIAELDETQQQDIKKMYREALMMAHPDKFHNEPEKKDKATAITSQLIIAYKANDIATIQNIWNELKAGIAFGIEHCTLDDTDQLNEWVAKLEAKLQLLQKQLASLQQNEDYLAAISNNWDDYFAQTQAKLENQIQVLKVEIEKRK